MGKDWDKMVAEQELANYYRDNTEQPTGTKAEWRKQRPIHTVIANYFPDALMEVAYCSYVGNEQHHPGEELWWDKNKSTDELDAMLRHSLQAGTEDTDGVLHSAKVAWRALANLQRELDAATMSGQYPPYGR